jgi:hypothetical protein
MLAVTQVTLGKSLTLMGAGSGKLPAVTLVVRHRLGIARMNWDPYSANL